MLLALRKTAGHALRLLRRFEFSRHWGAEPTAREGVMELVAQAFALTRGPTISAVLGRLRSGPSSRARTCRSTTSTSWEATATWSSFYASSNASTSSSTPRPPLRRGDRARGLPPVAQPLGGSRDSKRPAARYRGERQRHEPLGGHPPADVRSFLRSSKHPSEPEPSVVPAPIVICWRSARREEVEEG